MLSPPLAGTVHDRARGALLGLAAGDAVGTTAEFAPPGTFDPVTDMVGGGPFRLAPGQWTDDTSMALCLAESLVLRGDHDPIDQLRRYVRWWRSGYFSSTGRCFDIGNTTARALERFEQTGAADDLDADEDSAANGSLMRLAPVAIRWMHDPAAVVEQSAASSRTTHAARRPVDACRVLGAMTAALIRGEPRERVFDGGFWRGEPLHPAVDAVARGGWRGKEPPAIRGSGYCVSALEAAIWAVADAEDFRDAILRATNLGDDADTTAAIAGQLAGALFGASGIPASWRERLAMRARIESLADALLRAAQGEKLQWAHDRALHAWWADAEGRLLAGEFPGAATDSARTREKLGLLADAGIELIVDLTEFVDGLTPYDEPLRALAAARGRPLRRVSYPIRDVNVTTPERYDAIVADIDAALALGQKVYVHCWGGIGRTGTVVGCWHIAHGDTVQSALDRIADARASTRKAHRVAPESPRQIAMLHTMARRRGEAAGP